MIKSNTMKKDIESLFLAKNFSKICSIYESDKSIEYANEELYCIAVSYFKNGNFKASQKIIEYIDGVMSQNEDYLNLAGVVYRRLGNAEKALDYLKRGLEIKPGSPYLLNNIANIYLDVDRLDEAENILSALILNYPDFADAKINMERFMILSENKKKESEKGVTKEESSKDYDDPLLLAFESEEIIENLKRFKIVKKDKKIESNLSKIGSTLADLDGEISNSAKTDRMNLSEKLNSEGNPSQSLEISSKLYSKSGEKCNQLHKNISDSYLSLKRFAESEIYLLHSIIDTQEPANCESYLNLATFSIIRNDFILAEKYIAKAKQLDPSHPNIQSVLDSLESQKKTNSIICFGNDWLQDYDALKRA